MGCNSGKASPPGPQLSQLTKPEDAKPLLLGNEDPSASLKASPEMNIETPTGPEIEPNQIQEAWAEAKEVETHPGSGRIEANEIQVPKAVEQNPGDEKIRLHMKIQDIPAASPPCHDLHNACHFSPLSIVGVWHYDGRHHGSKYEISIHGDSLQIEQVVDNEMHRGDLRADGEWLVGTVHERRNGQTVGSIRLQHQSGKLLSNFKVPGGSWGVDLTATKEVPSSNVPWTVSPGHREEEKLRMAKNNGTPQALPAITAEDVHKAAAKAAGKPESEGRKQKGMCCC